MDILSASPLSQNVANTPDVQPNAQTRPAQAPEAPPPNRQAETVTSVQGQISDAARAVAARDQTSAPRPAEVSPRTDTAVTNDQNDQSANAAQTASASRTEGRATQEALRMFMDNAGIGVEQATVNASPLRTSA